VIASASDDEAQREISSMKWYQMTSGQSSSRLRHACVAFAKPI
jgi:hypothetical protein